MRIPRLCKSSASAATLSGLLAALAIAATPAVAGAQPRGGPPGAGFEGPRLGNPPPPGRPPHPRGPGGASASRLIERHAERLGLDASSLEMIESISDRSKQRDHELHAERRDAHDRMRALLSGSSPERTAVMAQAERISALELSLQQNRLSAMLEIRKMLDDEQRAELVEISKERKAEKSGEGDSPRGSRSSRAQPGPLPGCRNDIEEFCSKAGSGKPLLDCLAARYDSLSRRCLDSLEYGPPPRRH